MQYIKLKSSPKGVRFAHGHAMETFHNVMQPSKRSMIEITYFSEGRLTGRQGEQEYVSEKYDVNCNLHRAKTEVFAPTFHEHHSIAFYIDFEICEKDEVDALCLPILLKCSQKGKIHSLIDEIIHVHTLHKERSLTLNGLFLQLLGEYDFLARAQINEQHENASLYVRKAKEYVYQNIRKPITQKEIANHLGITPEYLCYLFKQSNEPPLMTYIHQVKLSKVREIMQKDHLKLYQAAEFYGYKDPNYVSRLFKKYYARNITERNE